jgi:hypothetical protein
MCGLVIVVCLGYHPPVLIIGWRDARCMERQHAILNRTPRQSLRFRDGLPTAFCQRVFFQLDECFSDCIKIRDSAP